MPNRENIFNSEIATIYINVYMHIKRINNLLSPFLKTIQPVVLKLNKTPKTVANKVEIM